MENQEKVEKKNGFKTFLKAHGSEYAGYAGFLVCLIVFTLLPMISKNGSSVWESKNFSTFMTDLASFIILAIGATFVYQMGAIDISIGAQIGVYGIIFIVLSNSTGQIVLPLLIILAIALVCAVFNAIIGAYVKLPAVMSSVILMQLFGGISYYLLNEKMVGNGNLNLDQVICEKVSFATQTWFQILFIVLVAALAFYLLTYTVIGKKGRAIGANKIAAKQAGVNILLIRIICFMVFSVMVVFSCFSEVSRSLRIDTGYVGGFQMAIMICLLMGGVPLNGGMNVKLSYAIVGAITYKLIYWGLLFAGVKESSVLIINAVIFLAIVSVSCRKPGNVLPR